MVDLFKVQSPESLGISSKVLTEFLETAVREKFGLHSLLILRHGKTALECYFAPYSRENVHILHSLSKSFTSIGVGFAVQEGLLSIEDRVMQFFPDVLPCEPCGHMKEMTLRNLLMMATGHRQEPPVFKEHDWVRNFLTSYPEEKPGSRFVYNTPATYMLSAVIQKVTGITLEEYLRPRLFEPLEFSENTWWQKSYEGITCGGFGLNLTTRDIAKFGQFLLHRGEWDGRQLLDSGWIDLAVSNQIGTENPINPGYGFQFWCCPDQKIFSGNGAFGQQCIVMPELDAVAVVTSGAGDMGKFQKAFRQILLPAMQPDFLEENSEDYGRLNAFCSELRVSDKIVYKRAEIQVNKDFYRLSPNPMGLKAVKGEFGETEDRLIFQTAGSEFRCRIKPGEYTPVRLPDDIHTSQLGIFYPDRMAAGGWISKREYRLYLYGTYDCVSEQITLTFFEDGQTVQVHFSKRADFEPYDSSVYGTALV